MNDKDTSTIDIPRSAARLLAGAMVLFIGTAALVGYDYIDQRTTVRDNEKAIVSHSEQITAINDRQERMVSDQRETARAMAALAESINKLSHTVSRMQGAQNPTP